MRDHDETPEVPVGDDEPRVLKVARVGSVRGLGQSRRDFLQSVVLGSVGGTLAAGTLAAPLGACSTPECTLQELTREASSDCRSEHAVAHLDTLTQVAFAAGAGTLFSAGSDAVKVWDLAAGTPLRTMATPVTFEMLQELQASSDGAFVVLRGNVQAGPGSLCLVMDGATGTVLWQETFGLVPGAIDGTYFLRLRQAAISPDGTLLALGLASPDTVELRDATTGALVSTIAAGAPPGVLRFSHDGRLIAGAVGDRERSPRRIDLWEVTTGRLVLSSESLGTASALAVGFTADDRRVVSVSAYLSQRELRWTEQELRVWDAGSGGLVATIDLGARYPGELSALGLSPDGGRLALSQRRDASSPTSLALLDTETGDTVCTYAGSTGVHSAVAFSPDGTEVVSVRGVLHRWSAVSGAFLGFLLDPALQGTQECLGEAPDVCTCHTVCGCDEVCNCDEVCSCDCESGGGSYYY